MQVKPNTLFATLTKHMIARKHKCVGLVGVHHCERHIFGVKTLQIVFPGKFTRRLKDSTAHALNGHGRRMMLGQGLAPELLQQLLVVLIAHFLFKLGRTGNPASSIGHGGKILVLKVEANGAGDRDAADDVEIGGISLLSSSRSSSSPPTNVGLLLIGICIRELISDAARASQCEALPLC